MKKCCLFLLAFILLALPCSLLAQGTAFTYQGRLTSGGGAATGHYDFTFSLFDALTGGSQIGVTLTNKDVGVTNGVFTVALDFGSGVFTGEALWLQIGVETNGGDGAFALLSPLQPLTPSPYAIYAEYSGYAGISTEAGSVSPSGVSAASLSTPNVPSVGQVLAFNGSSLVWSNVTSNTGSGWSLTGNAGTTAGPNFLGTTDNQPLELHVNGTRGWRLMPSADTPNVIGGAPGNYVAPGIQGATIGGGGTIATYSQSYSNSIFAFHSTIGGGLDNNIQSMAAQSTIGGGFQNTVESNSIDAFIGGGGYNTIQTNATGGVIAGGIDNTIQGDGAMYYGASIDSFIGGGEYNEILALSGDSVLVGGDDNVIQNRSGASAIVGGEQNNIGENSSWSFIGGGVYNGIQNSAGDSVVGGGYGDTIESYAAYAFIGGGLSNNIEDNSSNSVISGGFENSVSGAEGAVGGGADNGASGEYSTVAGGFLNQAVNQSDTVGGGGGDFGNDGNVASGGWSTVGGGYDNHASGIESIVGGGGQNVVGGQGATIPGGAFNTASGAWSFAAGQQADAIYQGDFVWADSQDATFSSTGADQFCVRAQGGVQLSTNTSMFFGAQTRQMLNLYSNSIACYAIGVQTDDMYYRTSGEFWWYEGGEHNDEFGNAGGGAMLMRLGSTGNLILAGTLTQNSDRNVKSGFQPVNSRDVLEKIAAMPVSRWHYTNNVTSPHIGPMAQDFYAAFGLGEDDKHITTVDEGGVALAAIQGLNEKVEQRDQDKDAEIQALKQQNDSLTRRLNELEAAVKQLAAQK